MACHCDLPVRITHKKRGWSRGEWSSDDYCGNCGEAITPRGTAPGRKLSRRERSARSKERWARWYDRFNRYWKGGGRRAERDYWSDSHYYIMGGAVGTRIRVTRVLKPSWTNIGKLIPLTKGIIYTVAQDPNNDFLAEASVCLFAADGDNHPEVTYYRVRPAEISGIKLR